MVCTSVSSSQNQFVIGTSATLPELERNHKMAKPQKIKSFVAPIMLAEFGPACTVHVAGPSPWALGAGMCHRPGYELAVLFLHVHTFSNYRAHKHTSPNWYVGARVHQLHMPPPRWARKIEVGPHTAL